MLTFDSTKSILPSAQKYEEESLVDQCWKVIDKHTEQALKSKWFATTERSLLEAVVERGTLTIEEIELFKAIDLWATKACERQGLPADGASKRRVLEEHIIKAIRFPTMKLEEFTGVVLDSDILAKEEFVSVIKRLSSVSSFPVGFPETKRCSSQFESDIQRCCRLGLSSGIWYYDVGSTDAISFSVDKDIVLHGVCLFGKGDTTCSVKLDVIDSRSELSVASKTGEFSSELLQGKNYSYHGYRVSFDREIILKKTTNYDIRAKITGLPSQRGAGGDSSMQCSGVTFTFMDSDYSNNATDILDGQFPELLFSVYKQ